MSIFDLINWVPLKDDQYIREYTDKKTIYIHHTAGNADPYGVMRWWNETPARVGTAFIIGGKPKRMHDHVADGELVQAFSSRYWAWHLGVKHSNMPPGADSSRNLNSQSIGIELCNWGYLTYRNGKFYTYVNTTVPKEDVITFDAPYRGYVHYHRYTDAQLGVLRVVLKYLAVKYNIPTEYKGDRMFDLCMEAFENEPGIWTHTSVRSDKTDCSPQLALIELLETLSD